MQNKTKIQECEEDCECADNPNAEKQINAILVERSKKTEKDLKAYIR